MQNLKNMLYKDIEEDKGFFLAGNYEFKENGKEKEAIDNYYYCLECFPIRYSDCKCDENIKKLLWINEGIIVFTDLYKRGLKINSQEVMNICKEEINNCKLLLDKIIN